MLQTGEPSRGNVGSIVAAQFITAVTLPAGMLPMRHSSSIATHCAPVTISNERSYSPVLSYVACVSVKLGRRLLVAADGKFFFFRRNWQTVTDVGCGILLS